VACKREEGNLAPFGARIRWKGDRGTLAGGLAGATAHYAVPASLAPDSWKPIGWRSNLLQPPTAPGPPTGGRHHQPTTTRPPAKAFYLRPLSASSCSSSSFFSSIHPFSSFSLHIRTLAFRSVCDSAFSLQLFASCVQFQPTPPPPYTLPSACTYTYQPTPQHPIPSPLLTCSPAIRISRARGR